MIQAWSFAPLVKDILLAPSGQFVFYSVQAKKDTILMAGINPIPKRLAKIWVVMEPIRGDQYIGVKQVWHDVRNSLRRCSGLY